MRSVRNGRRRSRVHPLNLAVIKRSFTTPNTIECRLEKRFYERLLPKIAQCRRNGATQPLGRAGQKVERR